MDLHELDVCTVVNAILLPVQYLLKVLQTSMYQT
jgi:hypothetical protein